jgi:hypothetical protein
MPLAEGWCMHVLHRLGWPSGVDHTIPLKRCTLCYSILSHATPILEYHASMSTLQNSVISRALWLPDVILWSLECTCMSVGEEGVP